MIGLIDYGINNLRSVEKACLHVGLPVRLVSDADSLSRAEKLILPGVGAYPAGMQALHRLGLVGPIRDAVQRGVPLLGICLGMQLLFDESEEMGLTAGLGLIPGRVVRIDAGDLPVPHMGWNQLHVRVASGLLAGIPDEAHAYFVHSYACLPAQPESVQATTEYGGELAAVVGQGNVFGIQFHPEKSQAIGLRILKNFDGTISRD